MRRCYFVQELDGEDGGHVSCVGKVFKEEPGHSPVTEQDYFDEAMTQMVAESYAQAFSRRLRPTSKLGRAAAARRAAAGGKGKVLGSGDALTIAILPVSVLKFSSRSAPFALMALEPHLPGNYVKHNDNTGRVETTQELPQAFSHFTLEASGHELVVCDIQGVGSFYTVRYLRRTNPFQTV